MSLNITLTVAEARQIIHMVRWLDGGDEGAEPDYDLADRLCDEIGKPRPAWLNDSRPDDSEDTPMATGHPSPGFPGAVMAGSEDAIVYGIHYIGAGYMEVEAETARGAMARVGVTPKQGRRLVPGQPIRIVYDGVVATIIEYGGPRHRDYNAMRGALADPVTHLVDGTVTRHPHTIRATAHGHDAVIEPPGFSAWLSDAQRRHDQLEAAEARAATAAADNARLRRTLALIETELREADCWPEGTGLPADDVVVAGVRALADRLDEPGDWPVTLAGADLYPRLDEAFETHAITASELMACRVAIRNQWADEAAMHRSLDKRGVRRRSCPHGYPDPEGHDLNPATGPCHTCGPAIAEERDRRHAANDEAARHEATASTTPRYTVERIDTPTDHCYVVRDPHGSNVATFDHRNLADTYAAGLERLAQRPTGGHATT